jgi:hypothetical protein
MRAFRIDFLTLKGKNIMNDKPILACDMHAIPADQRPQHEDIARSLFASVQEIRALPQGYGFRLPTTSETLLQAAQFVANERLCCPFFNFALEVEPNKGPMWLNITGGEGVKEFIAVEFPAVLDPSLGL